MDLFTLFPAMEAGFCVNSWGYDVRHVLATLSQLFLAELKKIRLVYEKYGFALGGLDEHDKALLLNDDTGKGQDQPRKINPVEGILNAKGQYYQSNLFRSYD